MEPSDSADYLTVGQRVRHYGHQWPEALRDGTAVVVRVNERRFGDGSYEVRVQQDGYSQPMWWNSLATVAVGS